MVSIRIWVEENRIITCAKCEIPALNDLALSLKNNTGPTTSVGLLIDLTDRVLDHISEIIDNIDKHIDHFEERIIQKTSVRGHQLRVRLSILRRRIIALRRHLAPQREALSKTHMIDLPWLSQLDKLHLLELADRTIRYLEDLDEARDRATVVQETISNIISEQTGFRMYVLSMVAAIFLPLGLITGLLGMNVGGIPGSQTKMAFAFVTAVVALLGVIEYIVFKKKRWM